MRPQNFASMLIWPDMLTNSKVLLDALKRPTPSALRGAKTTSPFGATAAPAKFDLVVIWSDMLTNSKVLLDALKRPTPSDLYGAKTTSPFGTTAAPRNFSPVVIWSAMLNNSNSRLLGPIADASVVMVVVATVGATTLCTVMA